MSQLVSSLLNQRTCYLDFRSTFGRINLKYFVISLFRYLQNYASFS